MNFHPVSNPEQVGDFRHSLEQLIKVEVEVPGLAAIEMEAACTAVAAVAALVAVLLLALLRVGENVQLRPKCPRSSQNSSQPYPGPRGDGPPCSTEISFIMRSRFGEVCSCYILTVLPGPACVLLNCICAE